VSSVLYRNGRVRSPGSPFATAFVVDGPTVAWVGEEAAADGMTADATVDLSDALVTPAFVDAHVHATATGLALTGLDLAATRTLGEALAAVRAAARPGEVLLGHGWDETRWPERRPPTAAELDRAAGPGGRVYLSRADLHSAVASTALLERTPSEAGRVRLADHHAVRARALAAVTPAQVGAAQRATRAEASRLGIGCLHEMSGPEVASATDLAGLSALAAAEPGPDVVAYWGELGAPGIATALALGARPGGDLFCDGSLGSHTAALSSPYADAPDTAGELRYDADAVRAHVVAATRAGLQAGFHCIGDRAVTAVLDGIDAAADVLGLAAVRAARHRLEHAECLTAEHGRAMGRLGVVASVQPAFDARWATGMYVDRLGAARAAATNPFAALAAAGVPLALGSDAPVTPLDPWGAVRAAVRARHPLSARAAFSAHTRGGARAARQDGSGAGELSPGAPATFAVWQVEGELVVQVPDERIAAWSTDARAAVAGLPDLDGPDPRCVRTVVRGGTTYDAGELSTRGRT